MQLFTDLVNSFQPLPIFKKSAILEVLARSEYVSHGYVIDLSLHLD